MFEFGRDIRRIFSQARESDLAWLELISVDLVEAEARQASVDAGRVSNRNPREGFVTAAALWREHARRSGQKASTARSLEAADAASRLATAPAQRAEAALERALTYLTDHDLRGDPTALVLAEGALPTGREGLSGTLMSRVAAVHARIAGRRALRSLSADDLRAAAALMDMALHEAPMGADGEPTPEALDLRLDRAALTLEAGIAARDARLLDQAGRDLRALVEATSPDRQPLTRARALTLCGAGLAQLAVLAGDGRAHGHAREMFDAAAEAFTPDHSPLDWAGVKLATDACGRGVGRSELLQAEAVTDGEGLVLGALARAARTRAEISAAAEARDSRALAVVVDRLRRRLLIAKGCEAPLDWAVDQIGMARAAMAHATMKGEAAPAGVAMAVLEAAETAEEYGVRALATEARAIAQATAEVAR